MKPKYGSFSLVVVVFIAAAAWIYINEKKQTDELLQASLIFKEDLLTCSQIKIKVADKFYEFDKKNGNWEIVKPIQDLASESGLKAFLQPIQSQQFRKLDTNKPKSFYGLDDESLSFYIQCPRRDYDLKLSEPLGPSKNHYIYFDNNIYVGNSVWNNLLKVNLSYLRESYILPNITNIKSISYTRAGENHSLNIEIKNNKWIAKGELEVKTQQVNKYINGLENLTAQSYFSNFISKKLLAQTNLLSPLLKLSIEYEGDFNNSKTWKMALGQNHNRYFLTTSHRNPIFEISSQDAKNMLWTYQDFNFEIKKEDTRDQNKISNSN